MSIKDIRVATGMTQKEFSEKYGIPIDTLKGWESGKRVPPEYVERLLAYYVQFHK